VEAGEIHCQLGGPALGRAGGYRKTAGGWREVGLELDRPECSLGQREERNQSEAQKGRPGLKPWMGIGVDECDFSSEARRSLRCEGGTI
jgi:hypothetical protein